MRPILLATLALLCGLSLTGCGQAAMTNDEIISVTHKCEAAGLSTKMLLAPWENGLVAHCVPRLPCK